MARKSKRPFYKSPFFVALLLLLAIIFSLVLWHINKKTVSEIPATQTSGIKSQSSNNTQVGNKAAASSGYVSPKDSGSNSSGQPLIIPSGTLVSNHRPSLSGVSSPSSEQSVCNTSSNATCYIEFTKDNEIKKLPEQTTDANGSTYWSWDVAKAGLSVGSWQVTAIARANGQTKIFRDSITLEVQP
jgi:hypothetical protein